MIGVFVIYSGQGGRRTVIPDSPFPSPEEANAELADYAVLQANDWAKFLTYIDGYGFILDDGSVITVPTKSTERLAGV